jgi:hypothetical protein
MGAGIATFAGGVVVIATAAYAQMDPGPATETTYGAGLPHGRAMLLWSDAAYPQFPLKPGQEAYKDIDGARMKSDVIALSQIAVADQARNKQWWGRFPGTDADKAGVEYVNNEFRRLGMEVEYFPYALPTDWRPQSWDMSYTTTAGTTVKLATAFPVSGTKGTAPAGLMAEAVWVGIGAEPDFIGRDVKGKAVIIYSTFVPGGRSHSASDRAKLFNSNSRAQTLGAAMVINVMAVPGNGLFQPEGGLSKIPQMTVSTDEGFALRDRLGAGERVYITLHLTVPPLTNVQTAWTRATLPGKDHRSSTSDKHANGDELIFIEAHTDGYFYAATDNNAGLAGMLELARHYAAIPQSQRPRTMQFVLFPDHHHGEVARKVSNGFDVITPWDTVALKLTMEHPSETALYMYNDSLTGSNEMSAQRWSAYGSPEFELMAFTQLRDFGVSVYAMEDTPKNGSFCPSFHTINHIVYHTSLDAPELVPAEGLLRSTRAFASIIDNVNKMTLAQTRGLNWPPANSLGTVIGVGPFGVGP